MRRRLRVVAVRRAVERQLAEDAPDDPILAELRSNDADAVHDDL